jgi:SH3-like domain-containing protein
MPTATATPAPIRAVMTGDVFLHVGPSEESARLGSVIQRGQPVQIRAVYGAWYRVRRVLDSQVEVIGWSPAEWIATDQRIPSSIVTPSPAP